MAFQPNLWVGNELLTRDAFHVSSQARQTQTLFIQHETEDDYLLKGSTWLHVREPRPEEQNHLEREPSLFNPPQETQPFISANNLFSQILDKHSCPRAAWLRAPAKKWPVWQSLGGQIL